MLCFLIQCGCNRFFQLFLFGLLWLSQHSLAQECKAQSEECTVSPEAQVLVDDQLLVVQESRFPKHFSYYPPKDRDDDQAYYILNEKPVLYVPNFLNNSVAEELKAFCTGRFVDSRIRGHDTSNVEKNEIRTR